MTDKRLGGGFAKLSREERRIVSRWGGRSAQAKRLGHQLTPKDRLVGGRKGGLTVSQDRNHMREIGAKGGWPRKKKS